MEAGGDMNMPETSFQEEEINPSMSRDAFHILFEMLRNQNKEARGKRTNKYDIQNIANRRDLAPEPRESRL